MFFECDGYVLNTEDIRYVSPVKHYKEFIKGELVDLAMCHFDIHFKSSSYTLQLDYKDMEQARKVRDKLVEHLISKGN